MKLITKILLCCLGTIVILVLPKFSYSQNLVIGSRNASLCYSTYSLADSWSLFQNQAGLAWQKDYWIGVHHENKYFVKNLGYSAIGGNIPVKPGTFGVGVTHFGYNQFNQTSAGLSYGMMLSKKIAAGINIRYHNIHLISEYGSSNAITAEGGIIYQPTEKLSVGAHVFNPTGSSLGDQDDLSTTFGIGLSYKPVRQILLLVQGDDSSIDKPVFRIGLEYNPLGKLSVRTGFASNPIVVAFGLGWGFSNLNFDLAFSYHEILGYTPHLSVSYSFGKTGKSE